jgi:exodeoxyribonuclease VII small subunit
MATIKESKKSVNFEKKLDRLEEITEEIEGKALPLNESIALYQEGKEIIKELEEALKQAEKAIGSIAKEIE